jgi:hypothetical protein
VGSSWEPRLERLAVADLLEADLDNREGLVTPLALDTEIRESRLEGITDRHGLRLGEGDPTTAPGSLMEWSACPERRRDAEDPLNRPIKIPIGQNREMSELVCERVRPMAE